MTQTKAERVSHQKDMYYRCKANGICVRCQQQPAKPGRVQCPECLDRMLRDQTERQMKRELAGVCITCGGTVYRTSRCFEHFTIFTATCREAGYRDRAEKRFLKGVTVKFVYSNYWRTWERVLCVFDRVKYVKLDITPINGWGGHHVSHVTLETVRVASGPDKKDIVADELPADVLADLHKVYPKEFVDRLLGYNYMSEVSLEDIEAAHKKSNGGGVPFEAIKEIIAGTREGWTWA